MKQPNTHYLRKFMEKANAVNAVGSTPVSNSELLNVGLALNDLLLYQRELEEENRSLKDKIATSDQITVELQGGSF